MPSPDRPAAALASLLRPLRVGDRDGDGRWILADLDAGVRLAVGAAGVGSAELTRIARRAVGAAAMTTSRSVTPACRGVLAASGARVGLDIETLARVAANATPGDAWLAPAERSLVRQAAEPVLELACHWILKEAFGKALGVGLALPLDRLAFGAVEGMVTLGGSAAPPAAAGWRFGLYRLSDTLFAVARQPTPFAPAGMKPPTPLAER